MLNGFVGASTHPVVEAVGNGEPQGKASTCHTVAVLLFVQAKLTEPDKTAEVTKAVGRGHVGAGPQVTLATHPAATPDPSDVNTNVKHPPGVDDVTSGGILFPV